MLTPSNNIKIYLFTGHIDMRKGVMSLSLLTGSLLAESKIICEGNMFIFRGRSADKIKILWYDGQGFCLYYKCFDQGKFIWPSVNDTVSINISTAQLSMLLEGIDWRNPKRSKPFEYVG